MSEKVLIVDDEKSIVDVLSYTLRKEGYEVERAYDGKTALEKVCSFEPQIVILDLMLPIMNGYDVCRKLEGKNVGIIMITAKNDIVDKVLGLELGADDYLTKPFDIREVIARVKSLSRRFKKTISENGNVDIINIKEFSLNFKHRIVSIKEKEIDFTVKEFEILYLLLSNPNIAYSRDQLLDLIWGIDYFGGTRTVDTHVQRVRKKLGEEYENLIITVHGIGYKGIGEVNEAWN